MKGLLIKRVCINHRHRQQCGDGQRKGGSGENVRVGKGEKNGSFIMVKTVK